MTLRKLSIIGILVGALCAGCSNSTAEALAALSDTRLPSLTLGSPAQFGEFGRSVAFFGDLIAVGAPDEARVHLYRNADGVFLRSIESPGGARSEFGAALAAWGRDLLIGAPGVGHVYLLDGTTGDFRLTFEPGDEDPIGEFGSALTVVGAQAWVGAPGRDGATGEVFRFALPGGGLLGRITSPTPEVGGAFGGALGTDGTVGAIGARGFVYVFDEEGLLLDTIAAPTGEGDVEGFGKSVALDDRSIVVGAPDAGDGGRAFVFDAATTVLLNKLDAPAGNTRFGLAVGLDGNDAIVAAAGDGPQVHMYDALSGALNGSVASRAESGSPAGLSLAVNNGIALIGAFLLPGAPRGLAQTVDCAQASVVFDLEAPTPTNAAAYGNSVTFADAGNRIVVGEPGRNNGEIHVYDGEGVFLRTITAPMDAQLFGHAIDDIDATRVVVGAPGFDASPNLNEGAAYIVNIETGAIEQTLRSTEPQPDGNFGFSVAGKQDNGIVIAVGAPGEAPSEGNLGRAYTFDIMGNGIEEYDYVGQDAGDLQFGFAVAMGPACLVVGVPGTGGDAGNVQVFPLDSNNLSEELGPPSLGDGEDRFGSSVAYLDKSGGAEIWAGAPNANVFDPLTQQMITQAGIVSVFDTDEFGRIVDLSSADPEFLGEFGFSLDADNDDEMVLVGAPGEREDPQPPLTGTITAHGVAHLYDGVTRIREQRLLSSAPEQGGRFGHDVTLVPDRAAGGAIHEAAQGPPIVTNAGRVTVHDTERVMSLYSGDPQDFGRFGECFTRVDFDTVLVGEPGANNGEGRVQLLNTTTNTTELTIDSVLGGEGSGFGSSVAVTADGLLVVGQPDDDTVYVFNQTGVLLLAEINTPNLGTGTFGASVAAIGTDILIGAPSENNEDGVAYLYTSAGSLLQTYIPETPGFNGSFGFRVASLDGDVLISAPGEASGDTGDNRIGRVYLFDTFNTFINVFMAPDGFGPSAFGFSIGSYQGNVLVGSLDGGVVWVIDRDDETNFLLQVDEPVGALSFGTSVAQIGLGQIAVGGGGSPPGQGFLFDFEGNLLMTYDSPNPNTLGGNFGNKVIDMDGAPMFAASTENVNPVVAGRLYLFNSIAQAPPPEPGGGAEFVLEAPNPGEGDEFGFAVGFAGLDLVVAAPGANGDAGVVFDFDPETGEFDDSTGSPNSVTGGRFGAALSIGAVLAAAGGPGETGGALGSGRAYLFSSVSGNLLLSFVSECPEIGGGFGTSVALAAANVAVGAPFENVDGTTDAGRVYYFDCIVPNAISKFASPNPTADGHFGASVAAQAFNVYVGAPGEAPPLLVGGSGGAGRAYCFNGLTGLVTATFENPDPESGSNFGAKIVMFGTNILVSAPNASVGQTPNAGRVYLINAATGALIRRFERQNPQSGDRFGACIATTGTRIFIGAPGANGDEGLVFEFGSVTGNIVDTFTNPNVEAGAEFGFSIATVAGNGIVGAPGQTVGGEEGAGAAYVNPEPGDED